MEPLIAQENRTANCKQADCPVRENGKCLESLDIENCSHFYWTDSSLDTSEQTPSLTLPIDKFKLFSGQDLAIDELNLITHKYRSNLVVIVGEADCGKTTLLSSIFDLFQIGKFPGFQFAGSLTSIGFEKKCHLSRESSKARVAETDRTNTRSFKFLHLAVKPTDKVSESAVHLLLSDVGGERFREATSSSSYMRELELLRHADHIAFLIDGEKLADKLQKTAVIANAHSFVKRAIDVGVFDSSTEITIVISKCDALPDAGGFDLQEVLVAPFEQKFGSQLGRLEFLKVAARPRIFSEERPFGFGLAPLLSGWVEQRVRWAEKLPREIIKHTRSFETYQYSYE